jgi:predicted nucleotidyltransferase
MSVLFNTKLRRKLLAFSFTHPDEDYYVRELSTLINEDPGNLSRELRKLEEEGLFASFTKGRVKFYSLNRKYPLFNELKKIIFKTEGVEGGLRQLISRQKDISVAFIYGSFAKNRERAGSDIDLVVVGKPLPRKFNQDIREFESRLNREINFNFYSREEFDKERKKEGGFLNLILKDKVVILKGALNAG